MNVLVRQSPLYLPRNWRDRLPLPASYYAEHVKQLGKPNAEGWAQGRCPLHDDKTASLSMNVGGNVGGWRCACCGNGDLVDFHGRLKNLAFKEAVRDLIGLSR